MKIPFAPKLLRSLVGAACLALTFATAAHAAEKKMKIGFAQTGRSEERRVGKECAT